MMISSVLFLIGLATTAQARLEKDMPKPRAKTVPLYAVGNEQWSGDLDNYLRDTMAVFEKREEKAEQKIFFNSSEYYRRKLQAIATLSDIAHMSVRSCPRRGIEIMGVYECRGSVARGLISRMGDLRDHDNNIHGTAYDDLSLGNMFKKNTIAENGTGSLAGNTLFKSYGVDSVSCSYEKNGEAACIVVANGPVRLMAPKIESANADGGKAKRAPAIVEEKRDAKPAIDELNEAEARKMLHVAEDNTEYSFGAPTPLESDAKARK